MADSHPLWEKPLLTITRFIKQDKEFEKFLLNNNIEDTIEVNKDYLLVTYSNKHIENYPKANAHNNSIAIASAFTAYSRVYLSNFKNNPLFTLLYSDTDSAFVQGKLPKKTLSVVN